MGFSDRLLGPREERSPGEQLRDTLDVLRGRKKSGVVPRESEAPDPRPRTRDDVDEGDVNITINR